MRYIVPTCLLVLSFTFACGDDALTSSAVCDDDDGAFTALVDKLFECYPEFELYIGDPPTNQEIGDACVGGLGNYADDGTIELGTKDDLKACLAAIDNADCETFDIDHFDACKPLVNGTIELGGECEADDQCIGDAYCDQTGTATCGTCKAQKADNETCFDNEECLNDLCSGAAGGTAGMCRAPGLVGDDCLDNEDCLGRLECNDNTEKCQVAQVWSAGDTCQSFEDDCGFPFSDLYCAVGITNTCAAWVALGGDCTPTTPCNLIKGETCVADKCVAPTEVGDGQACSTPNGTICAAGLVCSDPFGDTGGTCAPKKDVGDSCVETEDNPCGATLFLECVAGFCQYGDYQGICPA